MRKHGIPDHAHLSSKHKNLCLLCVQAKKEKRGICQHFVFCIKTVAFQNHKRKAFYFKRLFYICRWNSEESKWTGSRNFNMNRNHRGLWEKNVTWILWIHLPAEIELHVRLPQEGIMCAAQSLSNRSQQNITSCKNAILFSQMLWHLQKSRLISLNSLTTWN